MMLYKNWDVKLSLPLSHDGERWRSVCTSTPEEFDTQNTGCDQ